MFMKLQQSTMTSGNHLMRVFQTPSKFRRKDDPDFGNIPTQLWKNPISHATSLFLQNVANIWKRLTIQAHNFIKYYLENNMSQWPCANSLLALFGVDTAENKNRQFCKRSSLANPYPGPFLYAMHCRGRRTISDAILWRDMKKKSWPCVTSQESILRKTAQVLRTTAERIIARLKDWQRSNSESQTE